MKDSVRASESASIEIVRRNGPLEAQHGLHELWNPGGMFDVEFSHANGDIFQKFGTHNLVTTQGKNKILDVMFGAATQITSWYMGLVTNTGSPVFAVGDTAAQIGGTNGWTEATGYTGGPTREAWTPAAASAGSITNTTVVTFNIDATDTLKGAFIVSAASGTGGTLWAEVAFPSTVPVNSGDDVKVTYTLSS